MSDLINQLAQTGVDTIPPEQVTDYEWLLQNTGQPSSRQIQCESPPFTPMWIMPFSGQL
jgi:hypothetical protein